VRGSISACHAIVVTSALFKPDVQISRIRLARIQSAPGVHRSPCLAEGPSPVVHWEVVFRSRVAPSGPPRRHPGTRIRQGPFAPRELPRFHATMTPSDSCPSPRTVMYSRPWSRRMQTHSSQPGQVSQVPDRSLDARCPQPPRRARPLHLLVTSRPVSGFARS
jgi:hypothetical protein